MSSTHATCAFFSLHYPTTFGSFLYRLSSTLVPVANVDCCLLFGQHAPRHCQCDPSEIVQVLPTQDVRVSLGPRPSSSETSCCIPPGNVGPNSVLAFTLRRLALDCARAFLPVRNLGRKRFCSVGYTRSSVSPHRRTGVPNLQPSLDNGYTCPKVTARC